MVLIGSKCFVLDIFYGTSYQILKTIYQSSKKQQVHILYYLPDKQNYTSEINNII